ncbi:MAG: metal dependent phosphohydrolase [Proteobacteria bacterium]|nr:metal dependent phosphohydrolase [Pseudomonadota bacterium]
MPIRTDESHDRRADAPVAHQCTHCGHQMHDRQYTMISGLPVCEHCLLASRKQLAGLTKAHPYEDFVESLALALDLREQETGLHSKRVASHTLILAQHFYRKTHELREVYWGSLLHDVGKIGVPDAILLKPGRLTDDEWAIMRQHPENGFHLLEKLPYLSFAAKVVLCHEERFDGSGYPAGLKGQEIPLPARLFAVIDTLDAMTFDRPYRKALSFDAAKVEIMRMAGSQFDPQAVDAFVREEAILREMTALDYLAGPLQRL